MLGDDGAAEVHVHQPRGREPGGVVGEGGREGALVVVKAVSGGVVLAADIDDGVAFGQTGWVARAHERRRGIRREQTEEVDGESLVGMEMTA